MKSKLPAILLLLLTGCSLRGNSVTGVFDLGLAPALDAVQDLDVAVADVEAPQWLDNTDMHYRLGWRDRQSLQPYAESRWAGPPAAMLALRLRQTFNDATSQTARARCTLHTRLDEFSQVFSSEATSSAILQVHATLVVKGTSERVLWHDWHIENTTDLATASSGAAALAEASREFTQSVRRWVELAATCAR